MDDVTKYIEANNLLNQNSFYSLSLMTSKSDESSLHIYKVFWTFVRVLPSDPTTGMILKANLRTFVCIGKYSKKLGKTLYASTKSFFQVYKREIFALENSVYWFHGVGCPKMPVPPDPEGSKCTWAIKLGKTFSGYTEIDHKRKTINTGGKSVRECLLRISNRNSYILKCLFAGLTDGTELENPQEGYEWLESTGSVSGQDKDWLENIIEETEEAVIYFEIQKKLGK